MYFIVWMILIFIVWSFACAGPLDAKKHLVISGDILKKIDELIENQEKNPGLQLVTDDVMESFRTFRLNNLLEHETIKYIVFVNDSFNDQKSIFLIYEEYNNGYLLMKSSQTGISSELKSYILTLYESEDELEHLVINIKDMKKIVFVSRNIDHEVPHMFGEESAATRIRDLLANYRFTGLLQLPHEDPVEIEDRDRFYLLIQTRRKNHYLLMFCDKSPNPLQQTFISRDMFGAFKLINNQIRDYDDKIQVKLPLAKIPITSTMTRLRIQLSPAWNYYATPTHASDNSVYLSAYLDKLKDLGPQTYYIKEEGSLRIYQYTLKVDLLGVIYLIPKNPPFYCEEYSPSPLVSSLLLFEQGNFTLDLERNSEKLREIIEYVSKYISCYQSDVVNIFIFGEADRVSARDGESNLRISQKRAEVVRDHLVNALKDKNIVLPQTNIVTDWFSSHRLGYTVSEVFVTHKKEDIENKFLKSQASIEGLNEPFIHQKGFWISSKYNNGKKIRCMSFEEFATRNEFKNIEIVQAIKHLGTNIKFHYKDISYPISEHCKNFE